MTIKHYSFMIALSAALTAVASNARAVPSYDAWFSQAVSTDWNDVNNWEAQQPPTTGRTAVIGIMGLYEDVTCVIPSGTSAETGGLEISRYSNGMLTVEAGASLTIANSSVHVGYSGNENYTATLNLYGPLSHTAGGGLNIGGGGGAVVNIGP